MSTPATSPPNLDRFGTLAANLAAVGCHLTPRVAWNVALEAAADLIEAEHDQEPEPGIAYARSAELVRSLQVGARGRELLPDVRRSRNALVEAVLGAIDNREAIRADVEPGAIHEPRARLAALFSDVYRHLGFSLEDAPAEGGAS